jgi:hypothetical protein
VTATIGWLAVAITALALVIVALDVSGVGPFNAANRPLSQAQADSLLAELPPPAPTPASPTTSTTPGSSAAPTGVTVVALTNATLGVSCVGTVAELDYVSPAPGFAAKVMSAGQPGSPLVIGITDGIGLSMVQAQCTQDGPEVTVK